jgi:hypothetical protein
LIVFEVFAVFEVFEVFEVAGPPSPIPGCHTQRGTPWRVGRWLATTFLPFLFHKVGQELAVNILIPATP